MQTRLKKAALITFGCPKNQVDSEVMAGMLNTRGLELTADPSLADVVLINTCGFIRDAKKESIDAALEILKLKESDPDKKVLVWGCLAERNRGEIERDIPGADAFFGVEPFDSVHRFLFNRPFRRNGKHFLRRTLSTPPHRAYLKIADGCDHRCTFCAIPRFKGRYRSRTIGDLMRESAELAEQGVRELTLIAQDTTSYGSDLKDGSNLPQLLKRLVSIPRLRWIRILYAHPAHVTDELIELMSDSRRICRYIDMPLQHIADPVLSAMGRGTPRKMIENRIARLRNRISGLTLRSAFIVGFPGETEKTFKELKRFIQSTRFERLGVFRYSREEGTESAELRNPVPARTARGRYQTLMRLQKRISTELNRELENKILPVLVDGYDARQGLSTGRTEGDAPEIDQTVWIRGKFPAGEIVRCVIEGSSAYDLMGRPEALFSKGESR